MSVAIFTAPSNIMLINLCDSCKYLYNFKIILFLLIKDTYYLPFLNIIITFVGNSDPSSEFIVLNKYNIIFRV